MEIYNGKMQLKKSQPSENKKQKKQFRELLREIRLEKGLRQVDLAGRLGVPQSYVSKYESGEKSLDIFELRKICQILGIPLIDFVRKLEERVNEPE